MVDFTNIITKMKRNHSMAKKNASLVLAQNVKSKPIILPEPSRGHLQVVGPTGVGTSILFSNAASQDILNREYGVIVLGAKKDVINQLQKLCERTGRKPYIIDPTDPNTLGLNPLHGDNVDDICEINVGAFMWYVGERTPEFYRYRQKNAMRMAIRVAKYHKKNETSYTDLLDILLPTNGELRDEYSKHIKDETIRTELEEYSAEFSDPKMFNNSLQNYAGLIDYLKEITNNKYLRNIFLGTNAVNIRELFDNAEVLLVNTDFNNLNHSASIVGQTLLQIIVTEAFRRTEQPNEKFNDLKPVALYINDLDKYASESFGDIFEMTKNSKIMLNLFHQDFSSLRRASEWLEKVTFYNTKQKVIFGGMSIEDYQRIFEHTPGIEPLKVKMLPHEMHRLPGYNSETSEPAQVICLLNIDYKNMDEQIGFVKPLLL